MRVAFVFGMLRNFNAFQLAKTFHLACKKLHLPRYHKDQLFRASSSIALNLAEGSGKRTSAEQRRFYGIALGSLRECEAILELEEVADPKVYAMLDRLGAIVYTLSKIPESRDRPETATETPNSNNKSEANLTRNDSPSILKP